MIANPQVECMKRETLENLQFQRLKKTIQWVQGKTELYRELFRAKGVSALTLREKEDFAKFPWTTDGALADFHPMDRLTLPLASVLRASLLKGSRGSDWHFYTNGDIAHNVDMTTRALVAAGVNNASMVGVIGEMSDSRVLDVQYGLEVLSALVMPMGGTEDGWFGVLNDFTVDTLVGPSSEVCRLLWALRESGKSASDYGITKVIFLEDRPADLSNEAEGIRTKTFLAPLATGSATVFYPCEEEDGFYVQEDSFYVELIDEKGNDITEEGKPGEIVITSLNAEAMPLIRYRTGWQAQWLPVSQTGRTFRRVQFC